MLEMINAKIAHYEVMIEVIDGMIERRKEELKTETSATMKELTQGRIRELTGERTVYYKAIRDLKEIKEEAYTE